MTDHPGATKLNAETISDLTDRSSTHLLEVEILFGRAVKLAADDYPHNVDRLQDALGALRLIHAVVLTERYKWRDYARSRPAPAAAVPSNRKANH